MKKYTDKEDIMLSKIEKEYNKKIFTAIWVIMLTSIAFLLTVISFTSIFIEEGPLFLVIVLSSVVLFLIPCFFALKLEAQTGYYECKKCKHKFPSTFKEVLWAPHMGTTRYLKCPECERKTWCKKRFF